MASLFPWWKGELTPFDSSWLSFCYVELGQLKGSFFAEAKHFRKEEINKTFMVEEKCKKLKYHLTWNCRESSSFWGTGTIWEGAVWVLAQLRSFLVQARFKAKWPKTWKQLMIEDNTFWFTNKQQECKAHRYLGNLQTVPSLLFKT